MNQFLFKVISLVSLTAVISSISHAETTFKDVSVWQTTSSTKSMEIDLDVNNCKLEKPRLDYDRDSEEAWSFTCRMNLSVEAKPLTNDGYAYGDLRYRNGGGNFKSGLVSTVADGWNVKEIAAVLTVKKSKVPSVEQAEVIVRESLAQNSLKLRLTLNKQTCYLNGQDVSSDYSLCRK